MAWPNPFRRRDENTRTYWGYTFQLTPAHLTEEESRPLKFSYDKLGEECLNVLNEIDPAVKTETLHHEEKSLEAEKPKKARLKRDLYKSLEAHAGEHPKLKELWAQLNAIPEWVDWDQVRSLTLSHRHRLTLVRYHEVWISPATALSAVHVPTLLLG
jgi:hypothetical protein